MPQTLKKIAPMLITCIVAGLVLAVLSPYGTHTFTATYRFTFWCGMCVAGGLGAYITDAVIALRKWNVANWKRALSQSLTSSAAVIFTLLAFSIYTDSFQSINNFLTLFFYVWVVSATICFVGLLLRRQNSASLTLHTRPVICDRLKPSLRSADIYALAAEDHYVRVITSKGDDLILMRLSDAIKEASSMTGLSPHRSWWVSELGSIKVTKSEITLHSGTSVPISRTGLKRVKEAGWL